MVKKNNNGWVYWALICLIILGLLWLFYGGTPQEFIGIPEPTYVEIEEIEEIEEPVEETKTPPTPHISFDLIANQPYITQPLNGERMGERTTRRIMERLFNKPFPRVRPDFLKNPETGRNLELDGYNEELKIAFEYNGMQHYHFPNGFNKTLEEFQQQLRRDRYKRETCDRLGIYLITVPGHIQHQEILSYVWSNIHKNPRCVRLLDIHAT